MSDYRRYPGIEARHVQVRVGDQWYDGWLEAARKDGDEWLGYVRWTKDNYTRLGWFEAERIRVVKG